ncbi:MAG: DNA adenine methylase [Ktedonobacteraceae bacterium]
MFVRQTTLFDDVQYNHILHDRVVNVASVPQLSPFRYPGGKTWLVPYIRHWLSSSIRQQNKLSPIRPTELIEPFAGGGIIGLTAAAENLSDLVTMVEIDEDVAAVWQTIFHEDRWQWLARAIVSFDLTGENIESFFTRSDLTLQEWALKTIVRNRVNRGGILAQGAGRIKNGEAGKGIRSRWYPVTLAKRIQHIALLRPHITFIHGDGMQILKQSVDRTDAVFFIDPPYTVAGKKAGNRLYTYSEVDHRILFELAGKLKGDFLMTYDDTDEVRSLAHLHNFDVQAIAMKSTHHARMQELLIGKNLNWLR